MSCDSDLNEKECNFTNYFSLNTEEIVDNFLHNLKYNLNIGKNNFKSIVEAFSKIKK